MFTIILDSLGNYPRWLSDKESTCQAGDKVSIPESGRSPGEGNGNPLQYACLRNPMDTGAWGAHSMGLQRVGNDFMSKQWGTVYDSPGGERQCSHSCRIKI